MTYRVLLVGLGAVGIGYDFYSSDLNTITSHAKAFNNHHHFSLVGGVDPNLESCLQFKQRYGGWSGTSLEDSLRSISPDVVVVATPTIYHADIIAQILSLAKPKLILCEKPLAYSLEEAELIVNSCHDAGCLLYVNYLRRVDPGVLEVKRRLQSAEISSPLKGVAWYSKGLIHNGSHFTNLLEFWLGPVQDFTIINPGRYISDSDIEPDVQIFFQNGVVTFLAARNAYFYHNEIHLVAPNGCLRYEQGGSRIIWQPIIEDPIFANFMGLSQSGERVTTGSRRLQWHVTDHLSLCLRGIHSPLCSGDDALSTLKSLFQIQLSL